jgi:hypothetical protein
MPTTYLGAAARYRLDLVQAELYDHLVSDPAGCCLICQQPEPCRKRNELTSAILNYGSLPRRQPGQTRAGLRRTAIRANEPLRK